MGRKKSRFYGSSSSGSLDLSLPLDRAASKSTIVSFRSSTAVALVTMEEQMELYKNENQLKAPVMGIVQCLQNHFKRNDENFSELSNHLTEMRDEMNQNFDKICDRLNRVLGIDENPKWLKHKAHRYLVKHFRREFILNFKFKRLDNFEEEIDLFSRATDNQKPFMAEVTMSLNEQRKLMLCVDKRSQLAQYLNVQPNDIETYIIAMRMDSEDKEFLKGLAEQNDIKLIIFEDKHVISEKKPLNKLSIDEVGLKGNSYSC